MSDQYLFDNWQQALNGKQSIINGREGYYYYRQIATKRKTKFWGLNGEPYYTYHQERVFNDTSYNQDLAAADQNINNCSRAVDNRIDEYRRELDSANRTKSSIEDLRQSIATLRNQTISYYESASELQAKVDQATYEISSLESRISDTANHVQAAKQEHGQIQNRVTHATEMQAPLRSQTRSYHESTSQLQAKVDQATYEISSLESRISDIANHVEATRQEHGQIQNRVTHATEMQAPLRSQTRSYHESTSQLQAKVDHARYEISNLASRANDVASHTQAARQEHDQIQNRVTRTNEAISNFEQQISSADQQIHNTLSSASDKQRADMLAAIIDYPGVEQTINIIDSLGYDVNHLAYLAIEKNHAILLDLCISGNAQCTKYAVDGQTLLQRAISSDKNLLVSKILETGQEVDTTLLNAINSSDLKTIRSLANHDESCLHKLIHGYSLLHIAISARKHEVVEEILNLDINRSCVSDLTSFGESPFKIALRSSSEQIINILIPLVNVEHELSSLISSHARTLFERAMLYCETNAEINQSLLVKALENNELEIAAFLNHRGADFTEIFERANINHDEHILQNIIEIKPEFIDLLGVSTVSEAIQQADLDLLGNELTSLNFYE